jgi:uncharacterized protein involved in outer membrane biogenesis
MKTKKIISTVILVVVALVVVTLIVIGVFLDRIVKKAIEVYGPQMTQTSVTVDTVHLSLLTGSAKVKGLMVGNPKEYKSPEAIAAGTIAVGVDPMSVFSQKIVIHSIRLESPEVTFEGGLAGNNLSQLLDNVNSSDKSSGTLSTNTATQPASAKKFEVDDLLITGAKVEVLITGVQGQQTISLPDIHLTDLGKGGDGITAADLATRVLNALTSATVEAVAQTATNFGKNAATLKQAGQDAGKQILNNSVNGLLNGK